MPETREASVAEAAEQAAALRDYATAERLLRELLLLQKMRLGPLHADLANTFNNLGVVCDITDKPADAEFFYRRAMTIAKVSLAPDHEFIATSEKNLRDFCAARALPFESTVRLHLSNGAPETVAAETRMVSPAPPVPVEPSIAPDALAGTRGPSFMPWAVMGLAAVMAVLALWAWSGRRAVNASPTSVVRLPDSPAPPATETRTPPPAQTPSAVDAPRTLGSGDRKPAVPKSPAPAARESAPAVPREAPARDSAARKDPSAAPAPTVASARLCKSLSTNSSRPSDDWPCENPDSPADEGTLFFFTRVRSARDTAVEHRWYRGDNLVRAVPLEVRASPTEGYRTYSRNVVDARAGNEWRVELRTKDGILLHEERFTVR